MWFVLIAIVCCFCDGMGQSPCPEVFSTEPRGSEQDRWYGNIKLTSKEELRGVWLHITLDRPAELLGNWFGEATSPDNRDYTIRKPQHVITPNQVTNVRFFVKYNTARPVPNLYEIRLNGKTICMANSSPSAPETTESVLHISQIRPQTTEKPPNRNPQQQKPSLVNFAGSGDEDYFNGDFTSSSKPFIQQVSNTFQSTTTNRGKNVKCGTVVKATPLITSGQKTSEGEYPWHVALYRSKGVDLQYICGASLLSENHLITAAHCVTKPKTGKPINPEVLVAYLGKYNLKKFGSQGVQTIVVSQIDVHPEYNASLFHNDVAILTLEESAEFTQYVRPVCLWEGPAGLDLLENKLGTIVGWGLDETGKLNENLMQAKMPVVSLETCIFSNPDFFSRFTSNKSYCASFRNGTSACTGDSGGGMVFPLDGTQGSNTVWQLRGVVSLSAALQQERVVCDTSNYVIFSDVAKHLDWIRNIMNTKIDR